MSLNQSATGPGAIPEDPNTRQISAGDWIGFLAMVVGMFMAILDIQIVASSLSHLQAGLGASADEISWVQTSYLIAEVIMIPLSGWLARVYSTRYLFTLSCLAFTAASVACAFAWNMESMMIFRAIQGFLGGAMIPTVFATSFMLFPPRMIAPVSVIIGLVATSAPTLGPTLGGWITESSSWHWLFLINVPPGILVAMVVWRFVHVDKPNFSLLKQLDLAGMILVALFLGCLQYILEEGPGEDWFENSHILILTIVTVAAGFGFLWRELTCDHPVVDIRAFRDRNFSVGCLYSFIIGIGLYGSVYVMPLYLGRVREYSALDIGLCMMVTGVFQFLSAPLAGVLAKYLDLRYILAAGLALFGLGLWLNHNLTSEWGYWDLFLPQAVRGISLMLCFVPINSIALGKLPAHEVQNASGLYNLMRNLGGAIGLAAITTFMNDRTALHLQRLSESITVNNFEVMQKLSGLADRLGQYISGDPDQAALKVIYQLTQQQAMTMGFQDTLLAMSLAFAVALLFMPLVRKVDRPGAGDAGGH